MNIMIQTVTLGNDPEIKTTNGGSQMVTFRGAVKKSYAREGEDPTAWFSFTAFGKTGEHIAKYLKKGSKALITSEPVPGSYTKDNVQHYTLNAIVKNVEFLDSKKAEGQAQAQKAPAAKPASAPAPAPAQPANEWDSDSDTAELPFDIDDFASF